MELHSDGNRLGDNLSQWDKYRVSISQMLAFASMFQIPMVGTDVCGFGGNTTEELCARWASLGAFYPFYRNHNELGTIGQEFYRWPSVAESARKSIDIRYRLLDYTYSQFHRQSQTGQPFVMPMFYQYPQDKNTFAIDSQFFYGDSILVSPVTEKGATSVDAYFPKDLFYDWYTGKPLQGEGKKITLKDIKTSDIPLHVRGGTVTPIRHETANTTTALRKKPFELIIAPDSDGKAEGFVYIDDGDSIDQPKILRLNFKYAENMMTSDGDRSYSPEAIVEKVTRLGMKDGKETQEVIRRSENSGEKVEFDAEKQTLVKRVKLSLNEPFSVEI